MQKVEKYVHLGFPYTLPPSEFCEFDEHMSGKEP